jgi:hypothetical protein
MTHRPAQPLSEIAGKLTFRTIDAVSGHFIWEDAADEYAALVTAWWAEGFETCMRKSTPIVAGS